MRVVCARMELHTEMFKSEKKLFAEMKTIAGYNAGERW